MYFPGITAAIKQMVARCDVCIRFQAESQKEPLLSHPAPSRVWEKVGTDLFTLNGRDYLVTVCYLSGYFEVDRLPSKKITDVIYALRTQFARHGIPTEVVLIIRHSMQLNSRILQTAGSSNIPRPVPDGPRVMTGPSEEFKSVNN